jgi:hypothetical protein
MRPVRALIGDPRNDENRIVASLHTIMARFFNLQVDLIRESNPGADRAAVVRGGA